MFYHEISVEGRAGTKAAQVLLKHSKSKEIFFSGMRRLIWPPGAKKKKKLEIMEGGAGAEWLQAE